MFAKVHHTTLSRQYNAKVDYILHEPVFNDKNETSIQSENNENADNDSLFNADDPF